MHDRFASIEARASRFLRERLEPAVVARRRPLTIHRWEVPDEPVPFAEAVGHDFTAIEPGTAWSKPWGTTWFHVTGHVPDGWGGSDVAIEVQVDLGFSTRQPGFQAEGLAYRPDGTIIKAIEPLNDYLPVAARPGEEIDLYIEGASNPDVGGHHEYLPTPLGDKRTAGVEPIYRLRRIDLVERHVETQELMRDAEVLLALQAELGVDSARRAEILYALERMCDVVDLDDVRGTVGRGREALADVLAAPANASAHRVLAVGHAHIDSAWLWPTRETVRKCARTFSNVLDLMDQDPDFVFACSSAQQFAWVRDAYPELFERIRKRVADGRFVPVGGMWVESDTNMPGGEALVRQFVLGKAFFRDEFGMAPEEVWLPDSFGYSAAMPQIARRAGNRWFLTQKPSWNDTNRMPHHSFLWEGIDGSRIFTHFPPTDTYNSDLMAPDLARASRQYAEKGLSNVSLAPFGFGDGGGGPTREMVAAARRQRDLEGSPRVSLGTPREFFTEAEAELATPAVWSGEMYLELHRGTYTSQANTKRGNRRSEHLLREAELWSAYAAVLGLRNYPYDELQSLWETVLLQQFHDILPGSSIAWVHQQAEENYARVEASLETLISAALRALAGDGTSRVSFNAAPVASGGVPGLGAAVVEAGGFVAPVADGDGWMLDNGVVRAGFDAAGDLVSFVEISSGREVLAPSVGGGLQLFRDTPNQWDAWDVDVHYRRTPLPLGEGVSVSVVDDGLRVQRSMRSSVLTQTFRMRPDVAEVEIRTDVDWHEQEKLLKLAFPVAVHADRAASEIQFGHVYRPTHSNTSWDAARFETVAHRWVHVGEPGFGVVVANDSTYGHDITREIADDGSVVTLVRQSLLRGPRFPDPEADQGPHTFTSVLGLAPTVREALETGYRVNLPVRTIDGAQAVEPLVTVDNPAVVIESVKLAEDRSGDLVIRLYEALGGRATATVALAVPWAESWTTDLLERPDDAQSWTAGEVIQLSLKPFEIVTLRMGRVR